MSDKKDKIFADGLWVNAANEKAKEYGVKASIMIRVEDFKKFLDENSVNDKVYLTIRGRKADDKLYTELDQYRQKNEAQRDEDDAPEPKSESKLDEVTEDEEDLPEIDIGDSDEEIDPDDIPF
jgi:flagellar basal body-associated protein FliL